MAVVVMDDTLANIKEEVQQCILLTSFIKSPNMN